VVVDPHAVPGILGQVEESVAAVMSLVFSLSFFFSSRLSDIFDSVYMCNPQMLLFLGPYLFRAPLYSPIEYSMLVVDIIVFQLFNILLCFKSPFISEFVWFVSGAFSGGLGGCGLAAHLTGTSSNPFAIAILYVNHVPNMYFLAVCFVYFDE